MPIIFAFYASILALAVWQEAHHQDSSHDVGEVDLVPQPVARS